MSNASTPSFPDFGKLVPGFDFLQNLAKQAAGSATQAIPQLPNLGNWIAPTLNVEELDKRIQELKAVQFWLDQNAAALKATIQALEVQKMTLATLKGMNFNMGDVANAFKLKVADSVVSDAQRAAGKTTTFAGLEIPPAAVAAAKASAQQADESGASASTAKSETGKAEAAASSFADPMQWWGALTQQFQTIASEAMKDVATKTALDTTKNMATGLAKDALKTATDMATGLTRGMAESAARTSSQATPGAATANTAAKPKPKAPARKAARKTAP